MRAPAPKRGCVKMKGEDFSNLEVLDQEEEKKEDDPIKTQDRQNNDADDRFKIPF